MCVLCSSRLVGAAHQTVIDDPAGGLLLAAMLLPYAMPRHHCDCLATTDLGKLNELANDGVDFDFLLELLVYGFAQGNVS